MTYRAFLLAVFSRYLNNGWRFSDARSVTVAASDCATAGGVLNTRCHVRCQTDTES